jgi:hypothetical protein
VNALRARCPAAPELPEQSAASLVQGTYRQSGTGFKMVLLQAGPTRRKEGLRIKVYIISVIGHKEAHVPGLFQCFSLRCDALQSSPVSADLQSKKLSPPMCPVCTSRDVRPSRPRKLLDFAMRVIGQAPVRCRDCKSRFYVPARMVAELKQHRKWSARVRETADRDR